MTADTPRVPHVEVKRSKVEPGPRDTQYRPFHARTSKQTPKVNLGGHPESQTDRHHRQLRQTTQTAQTVTSDDEKTDWKLRPETDCQLCGGPLEDSPNRLSYRAGRWGVSHEVCVG
jgi:hypothetical protein